MELREGGGLGHQDLVKRGLCAWDCADKGGR